MFAQSLHVNICHHALEGIVTSFDSSTQINYGKVQPRLKELHACRAGSAWILQGRQAGHNDVTVGCKDSQSAQRQAASHAVIRFWRASFMRAHVKLVCIVEAPVYRRKVSREA